MTTGSSLFPRRATLLRCQITGLGSATIPGLAVPGLPRSELREWLLDQQLRRRAVDPAATGTTSQFTKNGLYASYEDRINHVEVFIDRTFNVLATHAVVQGVERAWQNAALPAGFDPAAFHNLRVVKTGATYRFLLDGARR